MAAVSASTEQRPLRIGAVCDLLREEFPDVSISKIRFLEDQGLLTLQRTEGGYRLFRKEDVERLRTILRLQRDEFLPLRVIREELASPRRGGRDRRRAARQELASALEVPTIEREELVRRAEVDPPLVEELVSYRLLQPGADGRFPETDVDVAVACSRLVRGGVPPKKLVAYRRGADNAVDVLIAANPDLHGDGMRRELAVERIERLSGQSLELLQLLFRQELRSRVTAA